jgi:hypothetical protein
MSGMTPINHLTAEPTLRLMVAMAGEDPAEGFYFAKGWTVFKEFLHLPTEYAHDVASFQIHLPMPEEGIGLSVQFVREFQWEPVEEHDTGVRRVLMEFEDMPLEPGQPSFDPTDDGQDVAIWSDDYPTVEAFLAAVEAHPTFPRLADAPYLSGAIFVEVEPAGEE